MNIVKLPNGKWFNLDHFDIARWSKDRLGVDVLEFAWDGGGTTSLYGEDASAMAHALDVATEGWRDYSKGVIHPTSPSEVAA